MNERLGAVGQYTIKEMPIEHSEMRESEFIAQSELMRDSTIVPRDQTIKR